MKKTLFSHGLALAAGVVLLCGCSASRHLPENTYMLNKVRVVTDGKYKDINTTAMKEYVRQKSNSRWLSTFKVPLGIYCLAGTDSSGVNRILRSLGEAPVVYDTLLARFSCEDLKQALENKGYLDAEVSMYLDKHKRKVSAIYVLRPGPAYTISHYETDIRDSVIADILSRRESTLRNGMQFSADALNTERSQITSYLQNRGYFRFHKEFISYRARKNPREHSVDLSLVLQAYRRTSEDSSSLHNRYTVRDVIYQSGNVGDTTIHLRDHVLRENTFIREREYYSAADLQNTYNHFGRLSAVKYTNISYEQVPDTTLLDATIQIQTNKPSTISFQPEGTNTAGDLGAAASLTYQNRNLFKGSEMLSVQLRGAYEAIRGLEGYSNQDFFEYSLEGRLSFPRFIVPFLSSDFRRGIIASSEVSLLYDSQDRPEFLRRVLSAGWHYQWKPQNSFHSYRMDLIDLNYVFMPWISQTFREEYLDNTSNSNAILSYNYEDLLIMKIGFGYAYNNGRTALKTNLETAGNLLDFYAHTFDTSQNSLGQSVVFNIAFAQYVKADVDFIHRLYEGDNSQLVFHVGLGVAYPYGNSRVLPFEKRYFAGGANSVRGWSVRSLGPGSYKDKDGRINFITQTGDMKLDLNLEYRSHLFWKFNGALFLDAGNIWTLRYYPEQEGGQLKLSRLLDDMAVGYGLGLRLNFDYFILRFDLGMKAVNPAYEDDDTHYPLIHPKLSRDLAFHFAVGLPF
jgi:outer membrane protein assembly factor BamA